MQTTFTEESLMSYQNALTGLRDSLPFRQLLGDFYSLAELDAIIQ